VLVWFRVTLYLKHYWFRFFPDTVYKCFSSCVILQCSCVYMLDASYENVTQSLVRERLVELNRGGLEVNE